MPKRPAQWSLAIDDSTTNAREVALPRDRRGQDARAPREPRRRREGQRPRCPNRRNRRAWATGTLPLPGDCFAHKIGRLHEPSVARKGRAHVRQPRAGCPSPQGTTPETGGATSSLPESQKSSRMGQRGRCPSPVTAPHKKSDGSTEPSVAREGRAPAATNHEPGTWNLELEPCRAGHCGGPRGKCAYWWPKWSSIWNLNGAEGLDSLPFLSRQTRKA